MRSRLLLGAILLAGCASVSRDDALRLGSFERVAGKNAPQGVVLGAPHSGDTRTDAIARELAQELGLPAVISHGYTKKETGDKRINVNRPTEGAGLHVDQEPWSQRAQYVFDEYRRNLVESAGGDIDILVEFHCTGDRLTGNAINIGDSGLSAEQARHLKEIYTRALDSVAAGTDIHRVGMLIEPIDPVPMGSGAAKKMGTMRLARIAMEIEMPISITPLAVGDGPYHKVYRAFLREAIPYLRGR